MTDADDDFEWRSARKKPVEVDFAGPFADTTTVETIEGDFEVDEDYLDEHGAYVIVRGVEGETYPVAWDIFRETYEITKPWQCDCDDPVPTRTPAKGTPAEKSFCGHCGGSIRDG